MEPLLGRIGLADSENRGPALDWLDWVVVGAESKRKRPGRHFNDDWAREIRDDCRAYNVPFFLKQAVRNGRITEEPYLDGVQHLEYPVAKDAAP